MGLTIGKELKPCILCYSNRQWQYGGMSGGVLAG
jgi:disulfide bond formation protein DsbB